MTNAETKTFLDEVLAGMKNRITHEERAVLMTKTFDLLREIEKVAKEPAEFSLLGLIALADAIGADYERWQSGEFESNSGSFSQRFVAAWSYAEASCFMLAAVGEADKSDQLFADLAKMAETEITQMLAIFAPDHGPLRPPSSDSGMDLTREDWQKLEPAVKRLSEAVVCACIDVDEAWEASNIGKALDEFKTVFDYRTLLDEYIIKRVGRRYQAKPSLVKAVMRLEVAIWLNEKGYDWQMVESCLNGAASLLSRVYTAEMIEYSHV